MRRGFFHRGSLRNANLDLAHAAVERKIHLDRSFPFRLEEIFLGFKGDEFMEGIGRNAADHALHGGRIAGLKISVGIDGKAMARRERHMRWRKNGGNFCADGNKGRIGQKSDTAARR